MNRPKPMSAEQFRAEFMGRADKDPDGKRVLAGIKARASGADFEDRLDRTHAHYRRTGYMLLERLPVNTAPMPRSWLIHPKETAGKARVLSQRSRFDFLGVLGPASASPGRMVAMEAKHSSEPSARLPIVDSTHQRGLAAHQLRACVDAIEFNALAFVVWECGEHGLVFPPHVLVKAVKDRAVRLEAADALPYTTRLTTDGVIEDWYESVRQIG